MATGVKDFNFPKSYFKALVGITEKDFGLAVREGGCESDDVGYPVFAFLKFFYELYKSGANSGSRVADEESKEINRKLLNQKHLD